MQRQLKAAAEPYYKSQYCRVRHKRGAADTGLWWTTLQLKHGRRQRQGDGTARSGGAARRETERDSVARKECWRQKECPRR